MKENKASKIGNFLAGAMWTTIVACASALTIAMTVKAILWMLF